MATVTANNFNDILVTSNGSNVLPTGFEWNNMQKVLFIGYLKPPCGSIKLCDSAMYGTIYCSNKMHECHPNVINNIVHGGCCVTFINSNDRVFVVLVQVNGRKYIMNPAGYSSMNEPVIETVIREVKEETGLKINIETIKQLATWEYNIKYAGLKWNAKTVGFSGTAPCPTKWNLQDSVNRINYTDKDGEVDYLLVVDIESGLEKSGLVGLHLLLVNEAINRYKLNESRIIDVPEMPYLTSFKFF